MPSKSLSHDDSSGFEFAKEMLNGDVTAGINFDRVQRHPTKGYIIFEYLLCEESQKVTPFTSHPRNYWHKNSRKFISLWQIAFDLNARLYLVNYAKRNTEHEDKIRVIRVLGVNNAGITNENSKEFTRSEFSNWFRQMNRECLQ